jgi:MSHA biogenesis protein MshK
MAASLNKFLTLIALLCAGTSVFAAESLPDPTKPAVDIPDETEAGKGGGAAVAPVPKKEGLQSIIIARHHRAAVINGEMIVLGGKIGDATLVEVSEKSVILEGSQGKRVLELFPGVHLSKAEKELPASDNSPSKKGKRVIKPEVGYKNNKSSGPVHAEQN